MNIQLFNAAMALALLMIMGGLAAWSVPLAFVVGGLIVLVVTLLLAWRVGVLGPTDKRKG